MINGKSNYRKAGWLSVVCGVWNATLGFLFGFGFIFSSFDIGWDGYDKVGVLYKTIAHNISWFGMMLFGIGTISSVLLIVGGILLLLRRMNKWFLTLGLYSMYCYFASFSVITFFLSLSGGVAVASLIWIGAAFVILIPSFFLHQTLRRVAG